MASSRANNIKKLDGVFFKFIRMRDADANGIVRCISCGKAYRWTQVDAGHFMSRRNMSTRFDEMNVWGQCRLCNQFKSGNIVAYEENLRKKIGDEAVDQLRVKANGVRYISDSELTELIEIYSKKVKELSKQKTL